MLRECGTPDEMQLVRVGVRLTTAEQAFALHGCDLQLERVDDVFDERMIPERQEFAARQLNALTPDGYAIVHTDELQIHPHLVSGRVEHSGQHVIDAQGPAKALRIRFVPG